MTRKRKWGPTAGPGRPAIPRSPLIPGRPTSPLCPGVPAGPGGPSGPYVKLKKNMSFRYSIKMVISF